MAVSSADRLKATPIPFIGTDNSNKYMGKKTVTVDMPHALQKI
ncbi:hypothetical protein ADMFC3_02950 [Geovibrio sp. ADMFC3]